MWYNNNMNCLPNIVTCNGYTKREVKLIKMFDLEHLIEDVDNPYALFRMCVEVCFLKNMQGPHVEALRRAYKAMKDCSVYRHTEAFEALLEF